MAQPIMQEFKSIVQKTINELETNKQSIDTLLTRAEDLYDLYDETLDSLNYIIDRLNEIEELS